MRHLTEKDPRVQILRHSEKPPKNTNSDVSSYQRLTRALRIRSLTYMKRDFFEVLISVSKGDWRGDGFV